MTISRDSEESVRKSVKKIEERIGTYKVPSPKNNLFLHKHSGLEFFINK